MNTSDVLPSLGAVNSISRTRILTIQHSQGCPATSDDEDRPDDAQVSTALEACRVAGIRALRSALNTGKDRDDSTLAEMAALAVGTALSALGMDHDDDADGLRDALLVEFTAAARAH